MEATGGQDEDRPRNQSRVDNEVSSMVAHEMFNQPGPDEAGPPPAAAPTPPAAPPPRRRSRGRLAAGIAALAILGGTGSGALTATLIDHNSATPAAVSTSTGSTTTSTSTQTASTAAAVY